MAKKQEIQELIAELEKHYRKVQEKIEYLALKRGELRPDDWISHSLFMDADEELRIERSLLTGHALMVSQTIAKNKIKLDAETQRILNKILAASQRASA